MNIFKSKRKAEVIDLNHYRNSPIKTQYLHTTHTPRKKYKREIKGHGTYGKRKIVIVSKVRFTIAMTLVLLLLALTVNYLFEMSVASAATYPVTKNILVAEGDTLWSIASEYAPEDMDVRQLIYDIKVQNNLTSELLFPGDQLTIPLP